MFLDYHNILWYYHHVIVFCATPIQAFQSVSEPHTLLSLYFSQQHHYAAEQWTVDFFVFEGIFSPAARMTPAMPSAGASIREDQDVILAFFMQEIGVLSVHPCDFLEMSSKSNTWVSCHRLSDGGYQAGCLSYMNDRVSMVFYAVDADVSGEYRKAIRRYRQMFFYENGTLFQSRLYPADTGNALEVSKLFRHLVQKAISRCLTEPNLWYLKTKRPDLNAHLSTYRGSLHYPDYNYHGNLSVLQGHRKDTELTIGAAARCVCCGNELRSNGAIKCSCKEVVVCRKCGQTVARGQGIYLEDGFYCKTCLHICAACGRPTLGTMYPAYNRRGTLVEVCQDCYQQLTSGCASCSMASACRAMGHTLCEKATVAVA